MCPFGGYTVRLILIISALSISLLFFRTISLTYFPPIKYTYTVAGWAREEDKDREVQQEIRGDDKESEITKGSLPIEPGSVQRGWVQLETQLEKFVHIFPCSRKSTKIFLLI